MAESWSVSGVCVCVCAGAGKLLTASINAKGDQAHVYVRVCDVASWPGSNQGVC